VPVLQDAGKSVRLKWSQLFHKVVAPLWLVEHLEALRATPSIACPRQASTVKAAM